MDDEEYRNLHDYYFIRENQYQDGSREAMANAVRVRRRILRLPRSGRCWCNPNLDPQVKCADRTCINRRNRVECPNACGCSNRRIRQRVDHRSNVRVACVPGKGMGLIATAEILSGSFITPYYGVVRREPPDDAEEDISYCFSMRYFPEYVVDSKEFGNAGRFANHSCAPNAVAYEWLYGTEIIIMLEAARDIPEGDEVCIDYGWRVGHGEHRNRCYCNAAVCNLFLEQFRDSVRCQVCHHLFASENSLSAHMDLHENPDNRPFVCPHADCDRAFRRQGDLNRHLETHRPLAERQVYHCRFCNSEYLSVSTLNRHESLCNPNPPPPPVVHHGPIRPSPPPPDEPPAEEDMDDDPEEPQRRRRRRETPPRGGCRRGRSQGRPG